MALRIVFCGTPAFALPALRCLLAQSDFRIEAVVTQPDRPRGRGRATATSPVKQAALEAGLHVYQPEKVRSDSALAFFSRIAPEAVVIIAFGQIIPARLLEVPRLGWINLHASLLPRYRGAAPINWAILNGETRTGLTTMRIDPGVDTGPTLLQTEVDISPDETASQLAVRMAEAGAPLVVDSLRKLDRGEITPLPQDNSQATLAPPLKKDDGRMNWSQSAHTLYNRIRGLEPWPGTFTTFRRQLCHIWGKPAETRATRLAPFSPGGKEFGAITLGENAILVRCGEDTALQLEALQLEGRKRVTAREFVNGARLKPGERFGD